MLVFRVTYALTLTAIATVWAAISGPFRRRAETPPTYLGHIKAVAARALLSRLSAEDVQAMAPSTSTSYRWFMKSRRLAPETVTLNDGSKAHWIGSSESDIIIVFFHGGGYIFPALNGHFVLLKCLIDNIHQKTQKSVAALVLQYDLAPNAKYPRPLEQAVALLQYVTSSLAIDPSRIVLAGESAGGGIALGLALHLSHPHPSIPKLELKSPFKGLALLSPWVTFSKKASSWTRNRQKDVLSVEMSRKWSEAYIGTFPSDTFSEPLTAPRGWWEELFISDILLTGGSDELFVDDIKELGAILDKEFLGKMTTIIIEGMAHGESIFSMMLGNGKPTREADAFVNWICKMTETCH